ncbi:unnamed protein product [Caenorhabditis nigoni]
MKLSKYPHLVQKEILDNMGYSDLFLLSFLSKNMMKIIKSSQIIRFKNINHINYDCCLSTFVFISSKHSGLEKLLTITECEETDNDYFSLNVSGKMIDFQISNDNKYPVAANNLLEKEIVIQSIHNYFINFFGDSVEFRWKTYGYKTAIPQLQKLSTCIERLLIDSDNRDIKTIENFLSAIPVLKFVNLFILIKTGPFSRESKFYQAESIRISQWEYGFPFVLHHFQGRQACLQLAYCTSSDLIELVNLWKSGKEFQKLEYLKIERSFDAILQNEVLGAIEAKYIDPTKKPPTHTLPKLFIDAGYIENPITSHTYVVRESDGHVASVRIQGKKFKFGVWSQTEEEFLRMVE